MKINLAKIARILFKINCILFVIAVALVLICSCTPAHADIKVMVIDTGIGQNNLLNSYVQYDSSDNYEDNLGHGTHVTGIILFGNHNRDPKHMILDPVCHDVKIYSCKYVAPKPYWGFGGEDLLSARLEIECIKRATRMGIDIINFSGGGAAYEQREYDAIKEFTDKGGWFVTAAGNDNSDLATHPYYPASYHIGVKELKKVKKTYENKKNGTAIIMTGDMEVDKFVPIKNMVVVESVEKDGRMARNSNRSPSAVKEIGVDIMSTLPDNKFGPMTGTSMATPAFLHRLLLYHCKKMEERKNDTTSRPGP